jgi:hypothetical protein
MPLTQLRALSNRVFGRDHQIEVAEAVLVLGNDMSADEVIDEVRQRSASEGGGRPSPTAIRNCLERLEPMGAVRCARSGKVGTADVWMRETTSGVWEWLAEVAPRDEAAPRNAPAA